MAPHLAYLLPCRDGLGTLLEVEGSEASSPFSDLFSTRDQLLFALEEHADAASSANNQASSIERGIV